MAVRTGQPYAVPGRAGGRWRASSDQAAPARDGSSGTRQSSSSTSLWTTLPRLEVIATSGRAASQATGRVTRVSSPTVASTAAPRASAWRAATTSGDGIRSSSRRNEIGRNSAAGWLASSGWGPLASRTASSPPSPTRTAASRRGSPGANSHPSARRSAASPGGIDAPGVAGEVEGADRGGAAVADPVRDVADGSVDAQLGDLAAAGADLLRPGLADGRLAGRGEGGEALEDLDVAAEAGPQVAERDRGLAAVGVHGHRLEAGLAGLAGVGEQPPAGQRPRLEPGHPADHEQRQVGAHEPARPPRRLVGRARRPALVHAEHATASGPGRRPGPRCRRCRR